MYLTILIYTGSPEILNAEMNRKRNELYHSWHDTSGIGLPDIGKIIRKVLGKMKHYLHKKVASDPAILNR